MDGNVTQPPNELSGRTLAFGYNLMPFPRLFYDELEYDSGAQVWHFAIGNKSVNIEILTENLPG